MLPKAHRLERTAFSAAFKRGRRFHTPGFLVIFSPAPTARVAVVVSKKVAKGAVVRNALRRRTYAALQESGLPPGHLIVIAKTAARTYTFSDIRAEISDAVARAVGFNTHSR